MNKVEISVLLPVYNGGGYLKESVDSVLRQHLKNFEFLIIDDCSVDGGREWLETLADPRIRYFKNSENRGLFFNLNYLIKKSKSPLIKLWAQDDIMMPDCLLRFVEFNSKHQYLGLSYSMREMIDEDGKIRTVNRTDLTPEIISSDLHAKIAYFTGSIAGNISNTCIRREALMKVGLFDETMKISADFDMWVRLAECYRTGFIREKLIKLRDHTGQLSRNEKFYINHVREDLKVYRYLDSYVPVDIKIEGKRLFRNNKLIFYFTLMIKSFIKGDLKTFSEYLRLLSGYESFPILISSFLKVKLLKRKVDLKM